MTAHKKSVPFTEFCPRLSFKLGLRVGCDHTASILESRNRPEYDPSDKSGLSHTVARSRGNLDGFIAVHSFCEALLDVGEDAELPLLGAAELFEFARLAPRKELSHEGHGVVGGHCQFFEKAFAHGTSL